MCQFIVEDLKRREACIVPEFNRMYPRPKDFDTSQVAAIGINSGKYDLNMIKPYFYENYEI